MKNTLIIALLTALILSCGDAGVSGTGNSAPVISDTGALSRTISKGESLTLTPLATDSEGDELTYSWFIDGVDASDTDTTFIFTPVNSGAYTVKFTVNDGTNTVSAEWTITVETAPPAFTVLKEWSANSNDAAPVFGSSVYSVAVNGDSIYVGTQNNGLYISEDNGSTWNNYTSADGSVTNNQIKKIIVDEGKAYVLAFQGLNVVTSTGIEKYFDLVTMDDMAILGNKICVTSGSDITIYDDKNNLSTSSSTLFPDNLLSESFDYVIAANNEFHVVSDKRMRTSTGQEFYGFTEKTVGMAGLPEYVSLGPAAISTNHTAVAADYNVYIMNEGIFESQSLGGGTVTDMEITGDLLYVGKYGNDMKLYDFVNSLWYTLDVGSWGGFTFLVEDIYITGDTVYIAHSKGLIKGFLTYTP